MWRDRILEFSKIRKDRLAVLVLIWAKAAWKDGVTETRWGPAPTKRGELVCSEYGLASDLNVPYNTMRQILKDLEALGEIKRTSNAHFTHIKVLNFEALSGFGESGDLDWSPKNHAAIKSKTAKTVDNEGFSPNEEGEKVRSKKLDLKTTTTPKHQPSADVVSQSDLSGSNSTTRRIYTDAQKLVLHWKLQMGHPLDDFEWDKVYFPRFAKAAKDLLIITRGDWEKAVERSIAIIEKLKAKNLDWMPETIVKHASKRSDNGN